MYIIGGCAKKDTADEANKKLHSLPAFGTKFEVIRKLISKGADINSVDGKGKNILIRLCESNMGKVNYYVIRELLQTYDGININATDNEGQTALMKMVGIKNDDIMFDLLFSYKPNINIQDHYGNNPLMLAIEDGKSLQIIRKLLDASTDVNQQDNNGDTALMKVYFSIDPIEISKLLIQRGAIVNHRNKNGKTLLDFLSKLNTEKSNKLIEYLIQNNALETEAGFQNTNNNTGKK